MKNKLLGSIILSVVLFLVAPILFPYLGWLLGTTTTAIYLLIFVFVVLALSLIIWLFKNRLKVSLPTFVSRLIIIISLATNIVFFEGSFCIENSYDAYGECLFYADRFSSALYSKTGKVIDHSAYHIDEYYGEDEKNSGFFQLEYHSRNYREAGVMNSAGGPYFWFKKSITNELYGYENEYISYVVTYSVTLYNRYGEVIDNEDFYVGYGYNLNKGKYYYDGREIGLSECYKQILHTLESDIEHHISHLTKTQSRQSRESVSKSQDNSKQHSQKKAKTRTTSVPVQKWKDCGSCFGSGLCQYCGGSGVIYYPTGSQKCAACGGLGRCSICAGRGGEYYTEYETRTETYYE